MGEFESLDQPLLLEFREGALLGQFNGRFQLCEGFVEMVESLDPTDVLGAHSVTFVQLEPSWPKIVKNKWLLRGRYDGRAPDLA
jgi:hypothetical protein